jgi:hypothetical protein
MQFVYLEMPPEIANRQLTEVVLGGIDFCTEILYRPFGLGVPGLKCATWRRETVDKESIWDEARRTSLSRL